MTTFEVELEREKSEKIAQVAARGAAMAREMGQDPEAVKVFLGHYFRHVDAIDVDERTVEDLLGLVESHYRASAQRAAGDSTIVIRTPSQSDDGWTAGGATVLQIITDDRPFLVDSVTMEVLRQGWSIREIFHPQFLVRRDADGTLIKIVTHSEATGDDQVCPESWMHLEVLPPSRPEHPDSMINDLDAGLREVLNLVGLATGDWDQMLTRCSETFADLAAGRGVGDHAEEAPLAAELLEWLSSNHFTFLGYAEFEATDAADGEVTYDSVDSSALGILRADHDRADLFDATPQPGTEHPLMIITKDDVKSRVHRPAYLDYVGIRSFDDHGRVLRERRFLGLFASAAYSESVGRIPAVAQKMQEVLAMSGYDEQSHGAKAILDVLESYPRDELFQSSAEELFATVEKVAHLKERRQVRLFVRPDPYGRYLSCLVYLPRDRYTTSVRTKMEDILLSRLGGASIDYTARVTESVLARLHFVVRMAVGESLGDLEVRALERELTAATRSWNDEFVDMIGNEPNTEELSTAVGSLPEGYKEDYSAKQALMDLAAITALSGDDMSMAMYRPDRSEDEADLRLKIFRRGTTMSLTDVLPHLSLLGVDVIDERPYELTLAGDQKAYIYDFGVKVEGGGDAVASRWTLDARAHFMDAFLASYEGRSEPDGFNALVMGAGLTWRQVGVLRAVGRYLRQGGSAYSQTYIAQALAANVDISRLLSNLFETKFDPELQVDLDDRQRQVAAVVEKIKIALNDVASLDHDRIVRSYLAVLEATVRTNGFQSARAALALKMLPSQIPDLPEPRPKYEIFVYSPRVEGVHLRFGSVARGGLRWSDRAEDFRTEVLGLVKAQMVKNTVIVPVGAKGGFYAKKLPDPAVDREAWMAEGVACYKIFISSLLDVTDNIVDGAVVPPTDVVRFDLDDPYLVVAADKGTASFSDVANKISVDSSFWLGDAFASGGSVGYDHKGMGITARGAWVSVQRHFREMGIDCQNEDFTCVGIGDMSGDVFGNGMLLSEHTKLVAAFDHRHVFIDPNPDPALSHAERARMFVLPRSTWADFNAELISEGGGIFPRSLKSITITEQMRSVLGIDASVQALSPSELITACLKAPVDLLWNGGIGTYVKGATETNSQVGDKANDGLRVNGGDLRARSVGEGGNLGMTQLGRIEYAANGGRINTDFIDNSAGVDTSDHEVNIKVLLAAEVAAGRLTLPERDELLASMTDEVGHLVLQHNHDQNLALANAVSQTGSMAGVHEDWMSRLEDNGLLDRDLEFLPSSEEMDARRSHHKGLTSPELATLLAYTKIVLEDEILTTDLPDDPALADRLINYFPTALRTRYVDTMPEHRLHREIISTVVVNQFVNTGGISCYHRLSGETGAGPAEVIRAQIAARSIFGAQALEDAIRALDHQIDAAVQTTLRLEVRTTVERATRWLINNRRRPFDITSAIEELEHGVTVVREALPSLLQGRDTEAYGKRLQSYVETGVPNDLATAIAVLPLAFSGLSVVLTAEQTGVDLRRVAEVHFALGQRLTLDRLMSRIMELPRDDRWQTMARAALRDDLNSVHAQLTAEVLAETAGGGATAAALSAKDLITAWEQGHQTVSPSVKTLRSITSTRADLARASVGLRVVRGLAAR